MMLQFLNSFESNILSTIQKNSGIVSPRLKFGLEVARLGQRLYDGNHRVAWCGVCAPFDLLNAMGIVPCFVEYISGMLSYNGMADNFLEATEQAGYAVDTCASHKAVIGAALQGIMPVPDFFIATTAPCTGGLAVLEHLAKLYHKDLFVLHIPQDESNDHVQFLARQLLEMVKFVSDHTGKALKEDMLWDAMNKSNQARILMNDVYRCAQQVPSPVKSEELKNFGFVMSLLLGTDAGIELAQVYKNEFEKRILSKTAGVPGERIRLLWIHSPLQFKNQLVKMLEDEYQAAIVTEELNAVYWDPIKRDDPYQGIAKRLIAFSYNGSTQHRIEHLKGLAQSHQVDGVINPCHFGCRQGTGPRGLIENGLREIGIPVLNLEVDIIDSRNFSEGQMRTRLEAFLEMIQNQSSLRKSSQSQLR